MHTARKEVPPKKVVAKVNGNTRERNTFGLDRNNNAFDSKLKRTMT